MLYAADHSWVFAHIPKTGGINIRENAKKHSHVVVADKNMPLHFNHQPLQWWQSQGIISASTPVYSVVRNPYNRLASLYKHVTRSRQLSFQEFCFDFVPNSEVLKDAGVEWRIGWLQSDFINEDTRCVRYETEYCSLESVFGFEYCHTHHNQNEEYDVDQLFCEATRDWCNTHFKQDFERWNYEYV